MLPQSGSAQTPTPDTGRRVITVTGTGTVKLEPDTADVQSRRAHPERVPRDGAGREHRGGPGDHGCLTADGIEAPDIVTSGYWVYPITKFDENGNMVGVTGYR